MCDPESGAELQKAHLGGMGTCAPQTCVWGESRMPAVGSGLGTTPASSQWGGGWTGAVLRQAQLHGARGSSGGGGA